MFTKMSAWASVRKVWLVPVLAGFILLFMFLMALFSSKGAFGDPGDSGTVDEIAHIPSGYTYDKDRDFRLNPEHPPLAKALAGLPLVLNSNIKGPESDWSWGDINQWEAGWFMIYEAGNNPKEVFFWSRLPMMLLMIGLGLFIFKWARELFGSKAALIVLLLYSFYPDVLAHGRLVTTDIAAAFGYVISIYYFEKALKKWSWKTILIASIAFALAQLLKFSAFLLFGILLILVTIKAFQDRNEKGFWPTFKTGFKTYFLVSVLSVIFVWIVYIPFVWKTPPVIEHTLIERNLTQDPRTLPLRNLAHKFENNPVSRGLGHYLLGIMLVIGRVEGGNKTFIMGHLSDKSISWYFPVAWLLKTQIPIIILTLISIVSLAVAWPKKKEEKWMLSLILSPIIVYWAFTLKGSLNIGIRHLMPTVPFVLLFIGYTINRLFHSKYMKFSYGLIAILCLYMVGSTLMNYPNFISYFNEATPKDKRYERLIDSSLDWGQDLLRLKKYIDDNKIETIKVDYFGGSVPSYYIPQATEWHSEYGPATGWIAVSATFYQSSKLVGAEEGKWSYHWLDQQTPKEIIGGSILVYDISEQDLIDNPPVSPYPVTHFFKSGKEINSIFNEQKY